MIRWGRDHVRAFPWRRRIPVWQGLVAELFLQRTRADQVVPVFRDFVRLYPTARAFSRATESDCQRFTDRLGLPHRVAQLVALARYLGAHGGQLPRSVRGLEALAGIGPYCAAALTSLHRGQFAVIIDANVVRVISRYFGLPISDGSRRNAAFRALATRLTPDDHHAAYNYALLDLAATVCTPRNPSCIVCPVARRCVWRVEQVVPE